MAKYISKYPHKDSVLASRHEIKYLIGESKAAAVAQFIRPYMRLDRYCNLRPELAYPIVSLYLDSENLWLCRQSMEGHKNRFKLRIRSYTEEPDYPHFFEIKRRANTVIIKDRTRVMPSIAASLISGTSRPPQDNSAECKSLEQFLLYMNSINAKPVVRTRYQRQAFEAIQDNKVRVTFDRNISYNVTSTPDIGLNGQGWHKLQLNGVVLEIKFTGRYPLWLSQMVKYFNLRQQSLSKYAKSVKRSCLLKFCAPKIPARIY